MKNIGLIIVALICSAAIFGQNSLGIKVIHADTKEPLGAATVSIVSLNKNTVTDSSGSANFQNLPAGKYKLLVSYVGFTGQEMNVTIPFPGSVFEIKLEPEEEEEEEVGRL